MVWAVRDRSRRSAFCPSERPVGVDIMYTNWSKSMVLLAVICWISSRMSFTRPSTCSVPSKPASICRTMFTISSTLTFPSPSWSKALKAFHRIAFLDMSFGFSEPATNSCRFTVWDPSRSRSPTTSSRFLSRSPSFVFEKAFRTCSQISEHPRTPSPLRSKKRKAFSIRATCGCSGGSCWAITRMTMRLKWPSLAFSRMLRRRRMRCPFWSLVRGMRSHGCRSSPLAVGRSPAFTLSMASVTSRASCDRFDQSLPNSTPPDLTRSTSSSDVAAQKGAKPVSIW
mmetsp:Transcript_53428/g.137856  ORF Transcript_53428/g.137856 Transcript_53428/m.137856 type:complete len:283 (-) Transcript_53428:17-865(-)